MMNAQANNNKYRVEIRCDRRNIMKTIWTVTLFLICNCTVSANEIRAIPIDEFNETIMPAIRKAESSIQNLEVEFELSGKQKPLSSASDDWKDSGQYAKVRLLSDGQRKGKIKIEVFIEKRGGRIIDERSYALSYNGKQGKKLLHGKTLRDMASEVKECTILSSRSDTIRSEMSAGLYGNPLILNFLGYGRSRNFSEYLKGTMDPKAKLPSNFSRNIDLVKFENTECVRIEIGATDVALSTYWLDPARNYAPLAHKHSYWDKEGKEIVGMFRKVLKFKKVSDDIWFPVKTQIEGRGIKIAVRKTITVSKVRINIKDLKEVDFDLLNDLKVRELK
jgi:hypothetical protein